VLENSEQFQTVADAVADCSLVVGTTAVHNRELLHTVRRLEDGGGLIRSAMQHGKVALLFGSEKFGLSIEDMSHCHWLMRIPTRDEHASMNLGQSVAICMYELIRSEAAVTRETKVIRPVDAKQRQRLTEMLIEVLEKTGYLNPRTATSTIQKTRRMINRLDLTTRDSSVWLGILRQILWKLGQE
jgi:tRNA/rRNA methyltransferase